MARKKERHGQHGHPLYRVWAQMKMRCHNENDRRYKDYGGRGIVACDEWLVSFASFLRWSLENGYVTGLTIDRKNNDGPYCPENCRWVTNTRNNRNKRTTAFLTAFGETKSIADWLEDSRCVLTNRSVLMKRLRSGWAVEDALSKPLIDRRQLITAFGETKCILDWTKDARCMVSFSALRSRISVMGMDSELALTIPPQHCLSLAREIERRS